MSNSVDKYKDLMNKPKPKEDVYSQFMGPVDSDNINTSINDSINENNTGETNVEVNISNIPVAKTKKSIRDTHKTKAFYIRNDIAKLIDKDIKSSRRGAMTEIVNALFEEYYRSQGRIK